MSNTIVNKAADNIRILSAAMVEQARSGHPGGAMGGADFVNILYSEYLRFDPDDPNWFFRDRFFLDPGHMSPMMYAALALFGKYSMNDLRQFRQWGSPTPGHPELDVVRGIENTSGPLGIGHAMAVGSAIAERFIVSRFGEWAAHKTFAFISDGGIQEEVSQGAGRIAGHLGLNNLIMFFDSNDIQLSTEVDEVSTEDTAAKYVAWNWQVITIDGNNAEQIREALNAALNEEERPTLIIGKTVMGKGALTDSGESFERQVSTHGQPLTNAGASIEKTISNLGGDPADPFKIFPEVSQLYADAAERKRHQVKMARELQEKWEKENPVKLDLLKQYLNSDLPVLDYGDVALKPGVATRATSSSVLQFLGQKVDNMIVMSADLSNSDKTEGFIKGGRKPLQKNDFSGGFLHAGVSELTMAAMANGIAIHGGIHVACGTFFVFSDFMKPAIRLAGLMELPVIYVWTHDAFRVGEDGPTHQPVEHEAQIRLLEKVKNHSGNNSMLVLRPADSFETVEAWKMALNNVNTPTGLILTRQNVKDLPDPQGSTRKFQAGQAARGAYVAFRTGDSPVINLVANGSEVSTLIGVAERLKTEKNIAAQVVSVISEGLFRNQDEDYQASVIPDGLPVFALTAGLPVNMLGLAGSNGKIYGLDHFGYSAPASVLEEKFGFTIDNIYQQVTSFLG